MTTKRTSPFDLDRPVLCLVIDRSCSVRPVLEAIEAAVAAGVDWLQIRERGCESGELLSFAQDVHAAAERGANGRNVRVLVNRRVDIALATQAAGVHLGFDAMSPTDARTMLGGEAWIGTSAHSTKDVEAAAQAGVDYVHLAPILRPLSKAATRPALGYAVLAEAARLGVKVLAQGGLEAQHCGDALAAGATGIAVTGSILMSPDPGKAAAMLRSALDTAAGG
ncbi:MAG: thiamine phosphate synthase [Myxococcales bacterium]